MQDIKFTVVGDAALQFKVPNSLADTLLNNIEKCEILDRGSNETTLLTYWGLKESTFLTQTMGIPNVPSPMLRDYKYPGLYKPFDHQRTTAEFLSTRQRAFCFNEAGTGKTSSVIWAADYLMSQGAVKRALVICPLTIMYSAWQADVFKTAMHRSVGVAYGPAPKRKKIVNGEYDFIVTNYDGVGILHEDIKNGEFDLIIVDEANAYKSTSTVRWKLLAKLVQPHTRLWMLTGTPASQSPLDAFGLARLVSPNRVPKYATAWRDKVMNQVTRFKWVPKPASRQIVFDSLQPAIRFSKAECLDLPEVLYQTREVPLTPQAAKYYKVLKEELLIQAAGEQISAVNAAARLSKLLQVAGGAVYSDTREVVEFDVSPRLKALDEVLEETENKVIVFVPFTHTIELVARHLTSNGVTNEIINGAVSGAGRTAIVNRFQTAADPRVLVIQPQAASHGVTLTAADTIVFWSPVMSVETYLQCVARIDRVGQKNRMTVVHLQGAEVERKMYQMLQGKVDSHEKLVDLYKSEIGENYGEP
jgi:SNF2 family DNA or RNA helicase